MPGVGNQQSIAGRIDCMILSASHIHSQFISFFLKIRNITPQLHYAFMLSCFLPQIRDFCAFFMPRKQHVVECKTIFKKSQRFLFYQFVVHLTKF